MILASTYLVCAFVSGIALFVLAKSTRIDAEKQSGILRMLLGSAIVLCIVLLEAWLRRTAVEDVVCSASFGKIAIAVPAGNAVMQVDSSFLELVLTETTTSFLVQKICMALAFGFAVWTVWQQKNSPSTNRWVLRNVGMALLFAAGAILLPRLLEPVLSLQHEGEVVAADSGLLGVALPVWKSGAGRLVWMEAPPPQPRFTVYMPEGSFLPFYRLRTVCSGMFEADDRLGEDGGG